MKVDAECVRCGKSVVIDAVVGDVDGGVAMLICAECNGIVPTKKPEQSENDAEKIVEKSRKKFKGRNKYKDYE